jgi:hypothetical protein
MPSGGARSRSGPIRNPGAIRHGRDGDHAGWVSLPASGREEDPPAWPLGRATKFERETWASEWQRPQAIAWERLGWTVQVALYVRTLSAAARPKASAGTTTNLLRQMENLGLTEAGMARNRWRIVEDAPAAATVRRPAGASARDRLTMISGGANARAS